MSAFSNYEEFKMFVFASAENDEQKAIARAEFTKLETEPLETIEERLKQHQAEANRQLKAMGLLLLVVEARKEKPAKEFDA